MKINIPQLVANVRSNWPKDKQPKGIRGSCEMAFRNDTCSAMGATEEDFRSWSKTSSRKFGKMQPGFENCRRPLINRGGFFLNQNSREPVTEPDEMVPLWKILTGWGRTGPMAPKGWAAENYCLFCADNEKWEKNVRKSRPRRWMIWGARYWLNTE
jgi:ribosomal protein L44E